MNAMFVIFPYKWNGQWVFDDDAKGLDREPFVLGIDAIIDKATEGIPNADDGFKLLFSPTPFPTYQVKLDWRREENGGNWYWCPQYEMEGWLCGALYRYFDEAPREIFAKPEPK
jgi:hypothetical protein